MSARHPDTTDIRLKKKAIGGLNLTNNQVNKIANYQIPAPAPPLPVQGGSIIPGGGTTFPILYPIDELGNESGATIAINLASQSLHYQKLVITTSGPVTVTFAGLVQNRAILFTLDITIGTSSLGAITWPSNLVNVPDDLPTADGSRYLLHIIGFKDSIEERYEVIGGSDSGGSTLWSDITINTNKDMEMFDLYNLSLIQFDTDFDSKLRQIKGLHGLGMTFDLGTSGSTVTDEYYFFKINGNEVIRFQNDNILVTESFLPNGIGIQIGNNTLPFSDIFGLEYHIGGTEDNILKVDGSNNVLFSVPSGIDYNFAINGINVLTFDDFEFIADGLESEFQSMQLNTFLQFLNGGFDPSINGMFELNGSDMKVYTGGHLLNLSNVLTNPLSSNLNFNEYWELNLNGIDFAGSSTPDPNGASSRFWIQVPVSYMTFNVPSLSTDGYSFQWQGTELLRIIDTEIFPLLDFGITLGDSTHRFGGLQINTIDFYGAINPHSGYFTGTLNMNDNKIENISELELEVGGSVDSANYSISVPASFMTFNVPNVGDAYSFQWGGLEGLRITFGEIIPETSVNLGDTSFPFDFASINNINFLQTLTPIGSAYFNGILDMHSNNIKNVADLFLGSLEFANSSTITDNSLGIVFNVPANKSFEFNVNNVPFLQINYNYGSGPSGIVEVTSGAFVVSTVAIGNPFQLTKAVGSPTEFSCVEGFQFDDIVYLQKQLQLNSPYTSGNYLAQLWDFAFFGYNLINDSDTNYGHVFLLNNTEYLQIVHNAAQTYPDFVYSQAPLWLVIDGTFPAGEQGFLIEGIITTEPASPPSGNIIFYTIRTGPSSGLYTYTTVVKFSNNNKLALGSYQNASIL